MDLDCVKGNAFYPFTRMAILPICTINKFPEAQSFLFVSSPNGFSYTYLRPRSSLSKHLSEMYFQFASIFSVSFWFKILNNIALLFKFLIFADEDWQSIISSYTSAILTKLHKKAICASK